MVASFQGPGLANVHRCLYKDTHTFGGGGGDKKQRQELPVSCGDPAGLGL